MILKKLGSIITDNIKLDFIRSSFSEIGSRTILIDLGCNTKPFEGIYGCSVGRAFGVDAPFTDYPNSREDVQAVATALPFRDSSVDIILCTEVLEHIPEPLVMLRQMHRVLKPGGTLIMTTPFMVGEHDMPYDYFRYTRSGLRYLLEKAKLEIRSIEPLTDYFGVLIAFGITVQLKFWRFMAKKSGLPGANTSFNPFILFGVIMPQALYLLYRRLGELVPSIRALQAKLSVVTRGYAVRAFKCP